MLAREGAHVAHAHGVVRRLGDEGLHKRQAGQRHNQRRRNGDGGGHHTGPAGGVHRLRRAHGLHHAHHEHHKRDGQHNGVELHGLQLRGAVPPRHRVGGHVPPAVPARQRQGQQEQHRGRGKGAVALGLQCDPREHHRAVGRDRGAKTGVDAEVVRPLRRREHEEEGGKADDQHHPLCGLGPFAAAGEPPQGQADAHQEHKHGEPARQRAVHRLLEQHGVAAPLLKPAHCGAHLGAHRGRLQHGGQRLVLEHRRHHSHARAQKRRDGSERCLSTPNGPQHPGQRNQEHADCGQTGRAARQSQRRHDGAPRGGDQAVGFHGALEQCPRGHQAEGDDRLRAGAVVVRQPERQEHQRRRPVGDPSLRDSGAKLRQDLAGEQPPRAQARQQRRQAHPHRRRAHLRQQRQQVVERGAKRGLRHAVPAVVVGHVVRVGGHVRHGEQVAVVGGVGAEDVPEAEDGGHQAVERLEPLAAQTRRGAVHLP